MKYVSICTALYDYHAQHDQEISFNADDTLYILDTEDPNWHKAQLKVTNSQEIGPIGLVPSNYIEKAKPVGSVKALYDYEARSPEELSFKENDTFGLYERDDPDWFVVETSDGKIGLVPGNYVKIEENKGTVQPSIPTQPIQQQQQQQQQPMQQQPQQKSVAASENKKAAVALYGFKPEGEEETYLEEGEEVWVVEMEDDDWWTVEHQNNTARGIVPAGYLKFRDKDDTTNKEKKHLENEQKEREEAQRREREEAERRRREETERREREEYERKEKEERERQQREELERQQKEHMRQEELKRQEERVRQEELKRQEEAEKQRRLEEERKRQLEANRVSPQIGRSQIPAPSPPPINSYHPPVQQQQTHQQQQPQDPNKPDLTKVRTWTDHTGAFKVEAQFLLCTNGKVRLFKTNGVKIDVPLEKMCLNDLQFIERETGAKLTDSIPLAHLKPSSFNWFDFFRKANLPAKASREYADNFEANKLTESDVDHLTHRKMKLLGMSERHVQRIQRFIERSVAEPASEDDELKHKPKLKKKVTFGSVSYIDDDDDVDDVQWQIEQDEKLARLLQKQEEQHQHHEGLQRRGTGRPTPVQSAPRDVSSSFLSAHQPFKMEPLQPVQVTVSPVIQPQQGTPPVTQHQQLRGMPVLPQTLNNTKPPSAFEDDAWTPRTSNSPIWNHPTTAASSTPPPPPPPSTPPSQASGVPTNTSPSIQMPPLRQRPVPQVSQQNRIDPQLLAKWGGSPALAAANSRPVPPPPSQQQQPSVLNTMNNNRFVPFNQPSTSNRPSITPQQPMIPVNNMPVSGNNLFNNSPSPAMMYNNHPTPSPSSFTNTGYPTASPSVVPLSSVLPSPLVPQPTASQGRNWANATPENPFGGVGHSQQQPIPQLNTIPPPPPPPQQQQAPFQSHYSMTTLDPTDKYAVFKTLDPKTAPPTSVFSNNSFYLTK
ncbi:MAG: hypothetical protein EXX96DRAFT_653204 [Benjaminiella poitrasii]|nr:MAG: hypothetical protein EXX96DRAFT_653204 [Benjaminiella poitrasii]